MTAKILDGTATASKIQIELTTQIKNRIAQGLAAPTLAAIVIGDHPASKIYLQKKEQMCQQVGITFQQFPLQNNVTETKLITLINELNNNNHINGIILQLPTPNHINSDNVIKHINPIKDVDGIHPYNLGCLAKGHPIISPCTAKGIMALLEANINEDLKGKNAAIVGRSSLVGKPMALELLNADTTVAICHVFTNNLQHYIANADLIVVAAGTPELIKGNWIKDGAIVIDVGINRTEDGKIVGDVEFNTAKQHASWITPVPGGVGPMTVITLMTNTLLATNIQMENKYAK